MGIVLAAVAFAGWLPLVEEGVRPSLLMGPVAGTALLVFSVLTFRSRRWAQVLLSLVGLALLGRSLPLYFQTSQMWPFLALILLGSVTFGIAILGVLLDMFETEKRV